MGSQSKHLEQLLHRLEQLQEIKLDQPYYIPGIWHYRTPQSGVVEINPFKYLVEYIRQELLSSADAKVVDYLMPLSKADNSEKDWLEQGSIYCLDIRTASSWDHNNDGQMVDKGEQVTELGTYLKTLFLLPHIKNMGLDILYLLPILKPSQVYSKGELGSFYSIKNFYQLNPDLHDPMLDLINEPFEIETEFKALVEACHLLGIRVIFDFPLRTAARDNDLMKEHPEWFYWIKKEDLPRYQVPYYNCCDVHVPPTPENLHKIYPLKETEDYISMFSHAPNRVDEIAWAKLLKDHTTNTEESILNLIEERFGLTTAPAYSDWINDPQPSWDDITFLRLYLDEPEVRDGFFDETVPPFLFFDEIKSNFYPGKEANTGLWDYLSGIIRFYQEEFGIDGARIDMAHALPDDLEKLIMAKSLEFDRSFKLISEDLQNDNHEIAKKKGYHCIIGESWSIQGYLNEEKLLGLLSDLPGLSVPSFACAETPDTPRAAIRAGERIFSRLVGVMNFFLPNTIPFVNNGFELYERQPMNLGLDNTEDGRYMLAEDDLYYGRLAFFDRYQYHWLTEEATEMINLIQQAQELRRQYWSLMTAKNAFYLKGTIENGLIHFGYQDGESEMVCLVNLDYENSRVIEVEGEILLSSVPGHECSEELRPGEFRVYMR